MPAWLPHVLLALMAVSAAIVPRLLPFLFALAGLVAAALLLGSNGAKMRARLSRPFMLAAGAFVLYVFVGVLWAINPGAALAKAGVLVLLGGAALALAAYVMDLGQARAGALARTMLIALMLGAAGLLALQLIGHGPRVFFHTWFPFLTGDVSKDVIMEDGRIALIAGYRLNHNTANMAIALFPGLLLAASVAEGTRRMLALIALAAIVVAGTVLSASDTTKVALVAGALVFALAHLSAKAARALLTVGWIAAVAFAVPLGALPHKLGVHELPWLNQQSVAARLYIWRYTAERVAERPLTGIGVRGTRELQAQRAKKAPGAKKDRYQPRPGRHAHNAYLQIWLELGALGAVLVLVLGLVGLHQIARWAPASRRAGYATFAVLACIAAFGWGIWQTWLLASFMSVWPLLLLGDRSTAAHRAPET